MNVLQRWLREESGSDLVEYALLGVDGRDPVCRRPGADARNSQRRIPIWDFGHAEDLGSL